MRRLGAGLVAIGLAVAAPAAQQPSFRSRSDVVRVFVTVTDRDGRLVTTLGQGDAFLFGSSGPAEVSGYPNVTVPAGYVGPLPVGMSFFSSAWADGDVLSFAYAFEQATTVRVPPELLPTIGP